MRGPRDRYYLVTMISPLLGYNNNVRHKGRVFHIQTEDSGIKHPHVITHLFADGGRILKTIKTSYSEHLESERLSEIIRDLMKQQHKAMFVALRDGRFDTVAGLPSPEPAMGEGSPDDGGVGGEARSESIGLDDEREGASSAVARAVQRAEAPDLFASLSARAHPGIETSGRVASVVQGEVEQDVEPPPASSPDLPPRTASGRYAQTRPASIFSITSTSAGQVVREQSLDEVILGYLAEDIGDQEPS